MTGSPRPRIQPTACWPVLCWLAFLVAIGLAYLPALQGELLFDDVPLLQGYECWHGLERVPAMLGFGDPNPCTYRPLRWVSFALDYSLFGPDPTGLHISNLLYHLLTVWLVYRLARRWTTGTTIALLVAALWALHPVNADAAAYISGRRDVLSTALFLGAYLALVPRVDRRLTLGKVGLGVLLFALAVQTKEMAVTLPAVAIWSAICAGGLGGERIHDHLKRRWPVYTVLVVGAVGFVYYRGIVDSHSAMGGRWWGGSATANFATVFAMFPRYLELVFWPERLIGDYFPITIPLARNFADPRSLLGLGLCASIVILISVSLRRQWRASAFGLGWFLIAMLPVSHIIPHHEIFAEHYLYLPLIGLVVAALTPLERLWSAKRLPRQAMLGAVAVTLIALSLRTHARAGEYGSQQAFYENAVARAPNNSRASYNLGLTYLLRAECERAVPLMLRGARYMRRQDRMSPANLDRFMVCAEETDHPRLVDVLVGEMLARDPNDPQGRAWQGRRALSRHDDEAAVQDLALAVHGGMRDADTVSLLALALNRVGQHAGALEVVRRVDESHQGLCEQEVRALLGLGVGSYDQAFRRVQACLANFPDSLLLLEFRAGLYYSAGRPDSARADVARMEALGADPETLDRVRAWENLRPQ